jgi:hypothetical protein
MSNKLIEAVQPLVNQWSPTHRIGRVLLKLEPPLSSFSPYTKQFYELYTTIEEKSFISLILVQIITDDQTDNSLENSSNY